MEFRQLMEPSAAKLACEKADEDAIAQLRQIYQQMVEKQDDLRAFAKLDCDFHAAIARIGQNPYVIKIYEIIADILLHAFSDIVSKRGNEAGLKFHKQILQAFESNDPTLAAEMMQAHMDDLRNAYSKL